MRLLIAGLGLIGARHLRHALALPGIEVVGAIDPARTQDAVPQFDSPEAVDVAADAIVIATPTHLHQEHAEAAAARGWHMLIEKPVAHSVAAADRIAGAAEAAGVQVLVGHHRRHHARVAALKAMLEAGEIGAPVAASMIWAMKKPDAYFEGNWRSGADGSPVMINLVHEVDLLRHLFGDVTGVKGAGSNAQRRADRVESGAAILEFGGGVVATIAFADTTPSPFGFEAGTGENPNIAMTSQDYLQIMGTKGAVSFPSLTVWSGAADWSEAPKAVKRDIKDNVPLDAQLLHFADVWAGRTPPMISAREGKKSLAATLEIEAGVTAGLRGRETSPAASARPPAETLLGSG
ncbi:MAG: Gfo/Idh/MocA family oxidoreductase [Pseudomonadota bacterium]